MTYRLTAVDVEAVQFTFRGSVFFGWGGYDETEVDDFLDEVAETVADYQRQAIHWKWEAEAIRATRAMCQDALKSRSPRERLLARAVLDVWDEAADEAVEVA